MPALITQELKFRLFKLNQVIKIGQVETDETENGNGKLKRKAETEKLKFGNGRQNSSLLYQDSVHTGVE